MSNGNIRCSGCTKDGMRAFTLKYGLFGLMTALHTTPQFIEYKKHCTKVFVASRPSNQFCSPECKNRYNVYKSRGKNKDKDGEENA